MITKIISGGQTGADRGGLLAAKKFGIETGGWMPKGFKAEDGFHPEFAEEFNIQEHFSSNYPPRTECNVKDSDGTIRIATDFTSPGEILTKNFITLHDKPHFALNPNNEKLTPEIVADWIINTEISVLNVAGNSESRSPGIAYFTKMFILKVLEITNA